MADLLNLIVDPDQSDMVNNIDIMLESALASGVIKSDDSSAIVPALQYYSTMDSASKQKVRDMFRSVFAAMIKEANILRPLPVGRSAVIPLAKLTTFGSQGSLTFVDGLLVDSTNPT